MINKIEKYNFLNYQFRASSFGNLMTGAKELTEKQLELIKDYESRLTTKKPLTTTQQAKYDTLIEKRDNPPTYILSKKEQKQYDCITGKDEHNPEELKIVEELEEKTNKPVLLTEKEKSSLEELEIKKEEVIGLTDNQQKTLDELKSKIGKVELSSGAKTYLRKLRREIKFKRNRDINSKYLIKGIHYEEEAITFLSDYHDDIFTNNKERRYNEYFQGECDVEEGFDTKVSWSLDTLPDPKESLKIIYEFQNRVYMILWNKDEWTTSSVVMDMTDDELSKSLYGEGWKWQNNEIPDWRIIEIIKYYVYNEKNFIRLCKLHDCIPDLKEYERQLKEGEEINPLFEKACLMFLDFVEIPNHERIVEKTIYRDTSIEDKMNQIAILSRQYMQDIEDEMYEKVCKD